MSYVPSGHTFWVEQASINYEGVTFALNLAVFGSLERYRFYTLIISYSRTQKRALSGALSTGQTLSRRPSICVLSKLSKHVFKQWHSHIQQKQREALIALGKINNGDDFDDTPLAEINTTPLVDVMLVLFVIFLVTHQC